MTYDTRLALRVERVFKSCETEEQRQVAKRYARLAKCQVPSFSDAFFFILKYAN